MKLLSYILLATLSLLIATSVGSQDLKVKTTNKASSFVESKINSLSNQISESISSFAQENFDSMKYLDFSIEAQEYLKPTFSIMSVNEIMKIDNCLLYTSPSPRD